MCRSYVLVNCMNSSEVSNFLLKHVCKKYGWKICDVRETLFLNRYVVDVEMHKSKFSIAKHFDTLEFVAYDTSFEFGDVNTKGEFDSYWLAYMMARCIKFHDRYLPDNEEYKGEVKKFLKKENLTFLSEVSFYKSVNEEDKIQKVKKNKVQSLLKNGEKVYLTGMMCDSKFWESASIIKPVNIVKFDYPIATDENGRRYVFEYENMK